MNNKELEPQRLYQGTYRGKFFNNGEIRGSYGNIKFQNCGFSDFLLNDAKFSNCQFENCNIEINEYDSSFINCRFTRCKLSVNSHDGVGIFTENCTFEMCTISGQYRQLSGLIRGCNIEHAVIRDGDWTIIGTEFNNIINSHLFINWENMKLCNFIDCEISKIIPKNTSWQDVKFISCQTNNFNPVGLTAERVSFYDCKMYGYADIFHKQKNVRYVNTPGIKERWIMPLKSGDSFIYELLNKPYEARLEDVRKHLETVGYPGLEKMQMFEFDLGLSQYRTRCRPKPEHEECWDNDGIPYMKNGSSLFSSKLTVILHKLNEGFEITEAYYGPYRRKINDPDFKEFWSKHCMVYDLGCTF